MCGGGYEFLRPGYSIVGGVHHPVNAPASCASKRPAAPSHRACFTPQLLLPLQQSSVHCTAPGDHHAQQQPHISGRMQHIRTLHAFAAAAQPCESCAGVGMWESLRWRSD